MRRLQLCFNEFIDQNCILRKFPYLEHVRIDVYAYIESRLRRNHIKQFIQLNRQIRGIGLLCDCDPNTWELERLECLEVVYWPNKVHLQIDHCIQFPYIEQLTISIINSDLIRFQPEHMTVLTFNRLKECSLHGRINDAWFAFLFENPTIEKLIIESSSFCLTEFHLMECVAKIPKLTEFSVKRWECRKQIMIRFLEQCTLLTKVDLGSGSDTVRNQDLPSKWRITGHGSYGCCSMQIER